MSFGNRLFVSVVALFVAFFLCVIGYQYRREHLYKVSVLQEKLQDYNRRMVEDIDTGAFGIGKYVEAHYIENLRLTVISDEGEVLYDNIAPELGDMANHDDRPEFVEAIANGSGYCIKRNSKSLHEDYFYSATYFPAKHIVVRSALPYDHSLAQMLVSDKTFTYMALLVAVFLLFLYYRYVHHLGQNITQLKNFAAKVEQGREWNDNEFSFKNDELGDIFHNIVNLYARLQQSENDKTRLKRQLTQNIAHELKTPVSSIQGFLETILNDQEMPQDVRNDFLGRCFDQTKRLSNLVNDISLLSRLDDAPDTFHEENVDVHELIETVRRDTDIQLRAKSMIFRNLTPPDCKVVGDYALLYSIFRNLSDNAIAYAGEGTTITVNLTGRSDEYLDFSFADNGVGVPEEHVSHIFERFYRVDKGRSRKLGGTGLGLAIVKNAVLLHHGSISAKIADTGGLEFRFNLHV